MTKPQLCSESKLFWLQISCSSRLTRNNWPPHASATQFCAKRWTFSPKYILPCQCTQRFINTFHFYKLHTLLHFWNDSSKSDFGLRKWRLCKCSPSVCCHCLVRCVPLLVEPVPSCVSKDTRVHSRPLPQSVPWPPLFGITHRPTCCMGRGWHRWTAC